MTSRERILAAINHQPLDRIPTDIWATPEVWAKLKKHFGQNADFSAILHLDGFGGVGPRYIGPPMPAMPQGQSIDFWGVQRKRVDCGQGEYWEFSHHPLAAANTTDDLDRYRWPSADWFDYSQMHADAAPQHPSRAIMSGYMAPFYFHNQLRGLQQSLMDPLDAPEFTHELLRRISDFFYEHHYRCFEACKGLVDVAQVTDDLGTQTGPMMSLGTFREFYRPHMQRMIDLCHGFRIKVFHHDDGAIRAFLPDLVEMGIDILNPIQSVCPGMEMPGLKQDFGRRLCFHGGIDNQRILPFGTEQEVRQAVRDAIDQLASDGTGYILAPCHNLQVVTPVENIVAMYDEAWRYGRIAR